MLLTPLKLTDLDEIFTGGTSQHGLLSCKILSKSEHYKYWKLRSKWKKVDNLHKKYEIINI